MTGLRPTVSPGVTESGPSDLEIFLIRWTEKIKVVCRSPVESQDGLFQDFEPEVWISRRRESLHGSQADAKIRVPTAQCPLLVREFLAVGQTPKASA